MILIYLNIFINLSQNKNNKEKISQNISFYKYFNQIKIHNEKYMIHK